VSVADFCESKTAAFVPGDVTLGTDDHLSEPSLRKTNDFSKSTSGCLAHPNELPKVRISQPE
jgi:hypothetical protein